MATKVLQCLCFPCDAYSRAYCIDVWHAYEACGLACLHCEACHWALCAPICIDLKCGDTGKAMEHCSKCLRYCAFACALDFVGCIDGCYNCVKLIGTICGDGVKGHKDLMQNTQFLHNKVKECLNLETGN